MEKSFKIALDIYFSLRYKERLTDYSLISKYEKKDIIEIRKMYFQKGGIDRYYFNKINEKTIIDENIFQKIKIFFMQYAKLDTKYYNIDRKNLFSDYNEIIKWFNAQENKCGYCGITQDELNEIVKLRGNNFTLNKKTKRKNATLEIEKLDCKKDYQFENIILACPICNNAKSNLIEEMDWKYFFVDKIKEYYKKILGKELINQ